MRGVERILDNFQYATRGEGQGEVNFINKKNEASNKWKEQNWRTRKNGYGSIVYCSCCGKMNCVFINIVI